MTDNDLIRLFLPIIEDGLATDGFIGVTTKQAYQPTQQGIVTGAAVYFHKTEDHRYGFLKREDTWDEDQMIMVHVETQQYETSFQVSSLVIQNPNQTYSYTASDLTNEVAAIMQSDSTIQTLEDNGVGILRVTNVSNLYFKDDKNNFEASPSFTFTLTHKQIRITSNPVIESVEFDIKRV